MQLSNSNTILLQKILQKKLILISGKGGVGKSLVAASLAKLLRARGRRVLVVESNLSEQLSPLLGSKPAGHAGSESSDGIHILNLDPKLNFKDFIVKHLGFELMFKKVFSQSLVKSFLDVIPGLLEMTLIGRLYYEAKLRKDQNFDHVIFDSFALGHHLAILQTPDAILKSELKGLVFDEVRNVKNFFSSKEVGSLLVSQPETLVLSEMVDFLPKLIQATDVEVLGVLVNRMSLVSEERILRNKDKYLNSVDEKIRIKNELFNQHREWMIKFNFENQKEIDLAYLKELFWVQEPLDLSTSSKLWNVNL